MPALECSQLHKSFGGVPVLRGVSLAFEPGTVNVLAGENGAGKSTLMKLVAGLERRDGGTIHVEGSPLDHPDPVDARAAGVSFIPQELAPLPQMRIDENLLLGRVPRNRLGLVDRAEMSRQARDLLDQFDIDVDPRERMGTMSVAVTQLVEIAKHTGWDSTVMLMDEPTASISEREIERLFTVIRRLRDSGVCVVYTTHKMSEIEAIADTVSVLRDGQLVSQGPAADYDQPSIVGAMIGREMGELFPAVPGVAHKNPTLEVRDLVVEGSHEPVALDVRPGEIVGLAGLVGAGRTELLEGIFGVRRSRGQVRLGGREVPLGVPNAAIAAGMAMVPEDRKNAGLVLQMSVADNTVLPHLRRFLTGGVFVNRSEQSRGVQRVSKQVNLRGRPGQPAAQLSGGNQQKVVLSRWLMGDMQLLLLDEPTRGVDVGARAEIYQIITELAANGVACLLASSELDEVVNLSHRVLVMRENKLVGEISQLGRSDADIKEEILHLAMGLPPATGDSTETATQGDAAGQEDLE